MGHRTLYLAATLLFNNVFADILVQPGYGQPHPVVQPHAAIQHPLPIHNIHQAAGSSVDPGYHLELHPVYSDFSQPQSEVVSYPLLHHPRHLSPLLPRSAHRRLHYAKFGGRSHVDPSVFIGHPHYPLAVHHRYRRSENDGSDSGSKSDAKTDLAAKSSLDDVPASVVDLQNQDNEPPKDLDGAEKHVEVRQSKNDHAISGDQLLTMSPPRMYTGFHEFRTPDDVQRSPMSNYNQMISETSPQAFSQMNYRGAPQRQETPQNRDASSQINPGNLRHAMLLQEPVPHQLTSHRDVQDAASHSVSSGKIDTWNVGPSYFHENQQYRNFPDPRPHPPRSDTPHEETDPRMSQIDVKGSASDEIVGTHLKKLLHLHGPTHLHKHITLEVPPPSPPPPATNKYNYVPYQNCDCQYGNPGYAFYQLSDGTSSNLVNGVPKTVQLYQLPGVQGTNYLDNAKYVILPQNNYNANYGMRYTTVPSCESSTPVTYYVKNSENAPSTMYRLV